MTTPRLHFPDGIGHPETSTRLLGDLHTIDGEDRDTVLAIYDELYGHTSLDDYDLSTAMWLHADRMAGCVRIARQRRERDRG